MYSYPGWEIPRFLVKWVILGVVIVSAVVLTLAWMGVGETASPPYSPTHPTGYVCKYVETGGPNGIPDC